MDRIEFLRNVKKGLAMYIANKESEVSQDKKEILKNIRIQIISTIVDVDDDIRYSRLLKYLDSLWCIAKRIILTK